jgi:hypothetical protein
MTKENNNELAKKIGDVDAIFHCAADVNLGRDPYNRTFNTNYGGTKNMLEIAGKISCNACLKKTSKNGTTRCHHQVVQAVLIHPEMRQVIEENKVGVVVKENSPEGLEEAIEEVMGLDGEVLQKNIWAVKKIYNWEAQEKVLLGVYEGLKE